MQCARIWVLVVQAEVSSAHSEDQGLLNVVSQDFLTIQNQILNDMSTTKFILYIMLIQMENILTIWNNIFVDECNRCLTTLD